MGKRVAGRGQTEPGLATVHRFGDMKKEAVLRSESSLCLREGRADAVSFADMTLISMRTSFCASTTFKTASEVPSV